jgi:hypothetical protein
MRGVVLHSRTGLNLPFPLDVGVVVLLVGLVVLAIVGYDAYRHYTFEGGS